MYEKTISEGFLLVDKPAGITSFDVIKRIRNEKKIKKVGHAGTLDPFATGVLIVAVGRKATKKIDEFQKLNKKYKAVILLGFSTDTDDLTGIPTSEKKIVKNKKSEITKIIYGFIGKQKQIPSIVSAKKINGKRAYKLHRQGKTVILKPKKIEIFDIKIQNIKKNNDGTVEVNITVECSTGTYIRALARDIGEKLKTGGHLIELRRIQIGKYSI